MLKQKRELKDIEVDEVSLVNVPANERAFLFWKRKGEGGMDDDLRKKLNELLGVNVDDDYISGVRKAYESGDITLYTALGTLSLYMSEMPEDMLSAMRDLVKLFLVETDMEKKSEDDIDMAKEDKKDEKDIQSVVEKAIDAIDESVVGAKKGLRELLPENVKKDAEDDEKWDKLMSGIEDIKGRLTILEAGKSESKEEEKEEDKEKKEKDEEEPITDVMKAVALLAKATTKNAEAVEKLRKTVAPKKSKDEETKLKKVEEDLWKSIDL